MPHDPTIFAPWPEREAFQEYLEGVYLRRWLADGDGKRVREIREQLTDMTMTGEPICDVSPEVIAAADHYGFTVDLRTGRMTNQRGEDVTIT